MSLSLVPVSRLDSLPYRGTRFGGILWDTMYTPAASFGLFIQSHRKVKKETRHGKKIAGNIPATLLRGRRCRQIRSLGMFICHLKQRLVISMADTDMETI